MSDVNNIQDVNTKPWYFRPRFIAVGFITIVFLVLILQNMESVLVQVLFWKVSAPAALLYFFFAVSGFIAARITLGSEKRSKPKGATPKGK